MNLEREVSEELWKTNLSRNRFAYLGQFLIITMSVWYQTGFREFSWPFTMVLAVCGCLFRFFATEIVGDDRQVSKFFMWDGFLFLGIAWSYHFWTNFSAAYPVSPALIYLWFTIGGTILVCHVTLVADPVSYIAFVTPIAATVMFLYADQGFKENFYVILNLSMMLILTSVNFRHQHKQLVNYIRARLQNTHERDRHKLIIDGFPGFVGITDADGVYVDGNLRILEKFPNLIGTRLGDLTPGSEYSTFVREFMRSGKQYATAETSASMNGEINYLMTTCRRLKDGAIFISLPINELVKARQELRDQEATAMYSAKLASIGQMAAGVAHEVNNPLAIIQGSARIIAGLVEEETIDRLSLKSFSDRIVGTTDRIAQIVRSLRSLSRGGEKDPFSPLSIADVISSCQDISNHNLKRFDIQLKLPENKKEMTILGREVQLGQVVLNLLSNSIYAVKDLPERWVMIDYGHLDGQVWLEVTDSGKGIPQEIVDKMMDPFFTTKEKDEGTGLGLSISSRIIEEHAGRLEYLADRPNTTFRLTFPTPKI